MGYRNYFYLIPKEITKDINQLDTQEQLIKYIANSNYFAERLRKDAQEAVAKNDYKGCYLPVYDFGEQLDEFGKLYFDNETYEAIISGGRHLFKEGSELAQEYEDYGAMIVGKEALKAVANTYLHKTQKFYEALLKTPKELEEEIKAGKRDFFEMDTRSMEDKFKQEIQDKLFWLRSSSGALDFDENKKYKLTNSYLYEYIMFQLVHQYKTIDFDKYDIIECGW